MILLLGVDFTTEVTYLTPVKVVLFPDMKILILIRLHFSDVTRDKQLPLWHIHSKITQLGSPWMCLWCNYNLQWETAILAHLRVDGKKLIHIREAANTLATAYLDVRKKSITVSDVSSTNYRQWSYLELHVAHLYLEIYERIVQNKNRTIVILVYQGVAAVVVHVMTRLYQQRIRPLLSKWMDEWFEYKPFNHWPIFRSVFQQIRSMFITLLMVGLEVIWRPFLDGITKPQASELCPILVVQQDPSTKHSYSVC